MNPVKYSIRDLERITGIRAHTIRMWEKRYGIFVPERTKTNIRYYSDSNLIKLLNISILNKNGFKISNISELSDSEIISEVANISDSNDQFDADINSMIMAAADLEEEQFEKTLNSSILKLGFEQTFCKLIFPLFQKMSVFCQIGRINNCQERFIINLVRQKLLVAIDGLVGQTDPNPRSFLLFQPTGDHNETGLLFANYLIRKSGHQVVYLGSSVQLEHLQRLVDSGQPKFHEILLNLALPQTDKHISSYQDMLRELFPTQKIHLVITSDYPDQDNNNYPNMQIYSNYTTFAEAVH